MQRSIGLLIALLLICQPALAWNRKGHATVAALAEANLTPAAQAQVKVLLKDDLDAEEKPSGRTTLAEIASWADEVREATLPDVYKVAHTRGNPVCSNTAGACKNGNCVDQRIRQFVGVLKNPQASARERNQALKFVVHLVGDLHMPLHSGNNADGAGSFPASLEGKEPKPEITLHKLWDGALLDAALKGYSIKTRLTGSEKLSDDAIDQWMQEARQIARQHAYDPLPGFACNIPFKQPVVLDKAYQQQSVPVIRLQIERAGLRLAQLLNETLQ